jgi:hypothetical protein
MRTYAASDLGAGEKLAAATRRTSRIWYRLAHNAISLSRGSWLDSHIAAPHSRISSAPANRTARSPSRRRQRRVVSANGGLATT